MSTLVIIALLFAVLATLALSAITALVVVAVGTALQPSSRISGHSRPDSKTEPDRPTTLHLGLWA